MHAHSVKHTTEPPRFAMRRRFCTSGAAREAWATVAQIEQLSPTTTKLRLRVDAAGREQHARLPFTFAPGQWVDFYIPPPIDKVGGYTITSLPEELPHLDLAVKASAHPPAAWCTTRAAVGDRVALRVGGSFVLQKRHDAALFVAGGVGINPLYSMLQALSADADDAAHAAEAPPRSTPRQRTRSSSSSRSSRTSRLGRGTPDLVGGHARGGRAAAAARRRLGVGTLAGRIGEPELETALRWLGCEPGGAIRARRAVDGRGGGRGPARRAAAAARRSAPTCAAAAHDGRDGRRAGADGRRARVLGEVVVTCVS